MVSVYLIGGKVDPRVAVELGDAIAPARQESGVELFKVSPHRDILVRDNR